MDKKAFKIMMIVVLLLLVSAAAVGIWFWKKLPPSYDPCEDMERMQNGDYDILFDTYDMTTETFYPWCEAILTIPQRVSFGLDDGDFFNNHGTCDVVYLCEDSEVSALAAELFVGKEFVISDVPIYELRHRAKGRVSVDTIVGGISIYFGEDGFAYVVASGADGYSVFVIEEDLQEEWEEIWKEMEPHCWLDKKDSFHDSLMCLE